MCRRTALGLACSSRNIELVVAFMSAGARDGGGDIDGLHRTLIRCGDHVSRRQLNACPYTTAFRRKKLNGDQSLPNMSQQQGESSRQGRNAQARRGGAEQARRQAKEQGQGQEGSPLAAVSADENNSGQPDAPKEMSRRRLAATGVNSLRALLKQNAEALAAPSPSGNMADEQQAKQLEQPRVRRGRGRFQGSEHAAAGDAPEPSMRYAARETKVCSSELPTAVLVVAAVEFCRGSEPVEPPWLCSSLVYICAKQGCR